ncbi:two-component system response regulator DcuR [Escherichia coli]
MRHSLPYRMLRKRPMKLSTTVILMVSAVLFSVLLVVHLIYFSQISDMTRDGLANKALAVARTLADSPEIRQGLQKKPQESGIQAIAEAVRKRNDLLFIVVTDMQSLRYSHPEAQRIGQPFKGDDILKALNGEENVAINRGFLAQALRVFTPIYDENHKQIGVVAIGLELSRVTQQINDSRWSIIWSVLFGMLVGLIGTCILVKVLKKILFGLEPYEISTLFEQRQAMLQSIKEGVVAVDDRGEVTLINDAAQELLNYRKSQDDEKLSTLSHSWSQVVDVSEVLRDGTPRRDEEITIKDRLLLINTVPVRSNGVIIGAISTFRDKTEVRKLMQRLDGLVNYADALRERSHEFMNKLHVILGLLHLKSYKQLEDYILKTANNYQEEIGSLLGKIKSPVIAGFLISKINRATDLGHTLILNSESQLPDSGSEDQVAELNRRYVAQIPGFQCCGTASTLEKAKEIIFNSDTPIDLILLDIYMQKENGLDLLPVLHNARCKSDVIVISSAADAATIKDSLHYGVVDYLIKPFQASRFEEALTGWRQKKMALEKHQYYDQAELDQLIHGSSSNEQDPRRLPKGLTPQTLRTLCQWIDAHQDYEFSTDELANEVNISRVSCRKYLIWLVNCHILFTSIHYGVTGRPVYRYRIQAEHYSLLKQYCQ